MNKKIEKLDLNKLQKDKLELEKQYLDVDDMDFSKEEKIIAKLEELNQRKSIPPKLNTAKAEKKNIWSVLSNIISK